MPQFGNLQVSSNFWVSKIKLQTFFWNLCVSWYALANPSDDGPMMIQDRSQTLVEDEASFERRGRELLGGSAGLPPPPRKFWNLEAQKCSCKHFLWHFSSKKSILGKCRGSPSYCLAILVPKARRGNCPVLPHTNYGPVIVFTVTKSAFLPGS